MLNEMLIFPFENNNVFFLFSYLSEMEKPTLFITNGVGSKLQFKIYLCLKQLVSF